MAAKNGGKGKGRLRPIRDCGKKPGFFAHPSRKDIYSMCKKRNKRIKEARRKLQAKQTLNNSDRRTETPASSGAVRTAAK